MCNDCIDRMQDMTWDMKCRGQQGQRAGSLGKGHPDVIADFDTGKWKFFPTLDSELDRDNAWNVDYVKIVCEVDYDKWYEIGRMYALPDDCLPTTVAYLFDDESYHVDYKRNSLSWSHSPNCPDKGARTRTSCECKAAPVRVKLHKHEVVPRYAPGLLDGFNAPDISEMIVKGRHIPLS